MEDSKLQETVLINLVSSGEESFFNLTINKGSSVFEGHFPATPILPGVIMIAIVKKAISLTQGEKMKFKSASNIKFLAVIQPSETTKAELKLKHSATENGIKIDAVIFKDEKSFFKMKALYTKSI